MRNFFNHMYFFWAVLALPSIPMAMGLASGSVSAEDLLHPSGEFAARFLIIAMMITPLRLLFPTTGWVNWLAKRRRALGVAAFAYALLHLLLYWVDMETMQAILAEFWVLGIWTGWAAFAVFVPLAVTSNDSAVRKLNRWWKPIHRWVYLAAFLTLIHWIFVHKNLGPALVHFIPLGLLEFYRVIRKFHPQEKSPVTG